MNIFLHELRTYRKSTLIWAVSLVAIASMYLFVYPAFAKDIEGLKKILENYPEALKKAVGFTTETFSTLTGFYAMIINFVTLAGSIQAMNIGLSVLSRESADKTADFLLTKPVSRAKVVTAKLAAALTLVVATNIAYVLLSSVVASIATKESFDMKLFLMISMIMFFVQMMFMAMGLVISVAVKKIRSAVSISLSTVFAFFILNMFGSVLGEDRIRYLTPFKFYDPSYVAIHSAYETRFAVIELIFVVAAVAATYIIYMRKDIHAV